jgi:hypothetical protein
MAPWVAPRCKNTVIVTPARAAPKNIQHDKTKYPEHLHGRPLNSFALASAMHVVLDTAKNLAFITAPLEQLV